MTKTGVWLIGAHGNVATTATVGAHAIARGEVDTKGMVTARPPLTELPLPAVDEFVFGGHDVRDGSVLASARAMADTDGVPQEHVVEAVADDLKAVDSRIRTGTAINCGEAVSSVASDDVLESRASVSGVVDQIRTDYADFNAEHNLDRVVVVNLASTEPTPPNPDRYDTLEAFEQALETEDRDIPASSLYAYAALVDGHPYVNFTPNTGSSLGGLQELAEKRNVPHVGRDGKTGETLVKSALAPMFAGRNLQVRSWEGHNILGNEDGRVLESDENKAGKLASKGGVLDSILDYQMHNAVRIDYAPSLGDWKTAWDFIHFEGFLDTEMTMQFTWQGSDSALAAPLVLDLVRLAAFADEHEEGGMMTQAASFFKAPIGVDEHDLSRQFDMLYEYARRHAESGGRHDGSTIEQ